MVPSRSTMKNAPHSSASACQRRGSRTAGAARPADADDSIVNLPGSFPVAAARSGGRIIWRSVMHTPRHRETRRPRAAQSAFRAVSIRSGSARWYARKARRMGTADLLARAHAGDGEAFRELTDPYRGELQVPCYGMLGSFQDAEDVLQDTLLAAWQGLGGYTEERASLRTWLYKIATNRCLNARRAASRRPARGWDMSQFEPPVPTPRDEPVWLQPFPDALLEGAAGAPPGPEARYEQAEAISL